MDEDAQRRNITLADWGAGTFGNTVATWGGRYLDVRSPAVRQVQARRLQWMAGIGCDGVDPGESGARGAGCLHVGRMGHRDPSRAHMYTNTTTSPPLPPPLPPATTNTHKHTHPRQTTPTFTGPTPAST